VIWNQSYLLTTPKRSEALPFTLANSCQKARELPIAFLPALFFYSGWRDMAKLRGFTANAAPAGQSAFADFGRR